MKLFIDCSQALQLVFIGQMYSKCHKYIHTHPPCKPQETQEGVGCVGHDQVAVNEKRDEVQNFFFQTVHSQMLISCSEVISEIVERENSKKVY